ncbi:hypothetical protein [Gramella sp. MAR_2010_147]|uniref:hypothetical protein n=1 Tax=Gramella sp. MAR_2010_147 TaxID=1250205 RepID=UPI00087A7B5A|nr:hypothetical protein [Gramella sp. MAR_2010_147]SDS13507.1 hypothetical protein SAMN04488553_1554 [Gramella sp. MAR_2010_147]
MDAKQKYRIKDVERLSMILKVNQDEAFEMWENFSSKNGGADWLLLPKEDLEIINWLKDSRFDKG